MSTPLERVRKALETWETGLLHGRQDIASEVAAINDALDALREVEEQEPEWFVAEYHAGDARWPAIAGPTKSRRQAELDCKHPLYDGYDTRVVPLVRTHREEE